MDVSAKLPSQRWIDRLFARLMVRYGVAWTRMWAGIDAEAVKADWASVLGKMYDRNPQALAYGLDHLPEDRPPTATAFLRLCLAAPESTPLLAAPVAKPDPQFAAAVHQRISDARSDRPYQLPAAECAGRLKATLARGGRLGPAQRHMLESCERMLLGGLAPEVAP